MSSREKKRQRVKLKKLIEVKTREREKDLFISKIGTLWVYANE